MSCKALASPSPGGDGAGPGSSSDPADDSDQRCDDIQRNKPLIDGFSLQEVLGLVPCRQQDRHEQELAIEPSEPDPITDAHEDRHQRIQGCQGTEEPEAPFPGVIEKFREIVLDGGLRQGQAQQAYQQHQLAGPALCND